MVRHVRINHLSNLPKQFYFATNVSDLSMHVRCVALFDNFCEIDYDPLNSVAWHGSTLSKRGCINCGNNLYYQPTGCERPAYLSFIEGGKGKQQQTGAVVLRGNGNTQTDRIIEFKHLNVISPLQRYRVDSERQPGNRGYYVTMMMRYRREPPTEYQQSIVFFSFTRF